MSIGADGCVEGFLTEHQSRIVEELLAFLRIPSVSAAPEHVADVERAAEWVRERCRAAGLQNAQVLRAGLSPVVYADWLGAAPGAPTILVYGHLDVQPPGDLSAWSVPPFEPSLRDGSLVARGASDDKGNMLIPILAVEAFLATEGRLPVNLRVLFEGQEEILSPDMPEFVRRHKARLACDLVVSADGWQWSATEADLRVALRGVCALDVTVTGPASELHSGSFGGAVLNPATALVRMLASLHDDDGRVAVPCFYDDVRALTKTEQERLAQVPFDPDVFRHTARGGLLWGEAGFTTRERIGARPSVEINGIGGGYVGAGIRTIIPARASAKITCRLVADQDPARIRDLVRRHILNQAPIGSAVQVTALPNAGRPYRMREDHPGLMAAAAVLRRIYGREPYYTRSGGSIPILELFLTELGAHTVVFGFGLPDERFHGPDEFFRLDSFRRGQSAYVYFLRELARASTLKPSQIAAK